MTLLDKLKATAAGLKGRSTFYSDTPDATGALAALRSTFPSSQLSEDFKTLTLYGSSWGSFAAPSPALIILHAECTEDVVKCVRIATQFNIVIIPVGGRTSLEGQFLPATCCNPPKSDQALPSSPTSNPRLSSPETRPTIHLSLSRMDSITLYPSDFIAVVGPGAGWQSLNEHLEEKGIEQFFPIDPAPRSEFGGMVAVGGSGTNAVGYGTMRGEWVQNMEVVLMSGEVLKTKGASRARKSSTGWDVGRLFLGSEGTLGVSTSCDPLPLLAAKDETAPLCSFAQIITSLTVRTTPLVPLTVAIASFATIAQAVASVVSIIQAGLSPTSLELLDGLSIKAMNLAQLLPEVLAEEPTVMMRFGSSFSEVVDACMKKVKTIVEKNGGRELRVAKDEKESERFWKARKAQYWSQQLLLQPSPSDPPCRTLITDICVPISSLPEFISRSDALVDPLAPKGILAPVVAHAGDGNVHRAILYLPDRDGEAPNEVAELAEQLCLLAIELGGTTSGEHGVGLSKRKYLRRDIGKETLSVMRRVKGLLDPKGLLNPGKVIYETEEEEERVSKL